MMTPSGAINPTTSHTVSVPLSASVTGAAIVAAVGSPSLAACSPARSAAGGSGGCARRRHREGGVTPVYELTNVSKVYRAGARTVEAVTASTSRSPTASGSRSGAVPGTASPRC